MTSGTPESIQNWVLSGFQNCLDFASMSCFEAKEISSSVIATSVTAARREPLCNRMGGSAKPKSYRSDRLLSRG